MFTLYNPTHFQSVAIAQERWLGITIFHIPSIMGVLRIRIPPSKPLHSIYSCGMILPQVSL